MAQLEPRRKCKLLHYTTTVANCCRLRADGKDGSLPRVSEYKEQEADYADQQ